MGNSMRRGQQFFKLVRTRDSEATGNGRLGLWSSVVAGTSLMGKYHRMANNIRQTKKTRGTELLARTGYGWPLVFMCCWREHHG